jgi:TonB family protein
MIAVVDTLDVEGSVPHPRIAKSIVLLVFLTSAAFLISGIVAASPNPSKQQGHLIPAQPSHAETIGFKVLSSTGGIDFEPYLTTTLFKSIVRSFHAMIPKSVAAGEKEAVVVQVRIQKDGSLADRFVTIVSSSGEKEFEAAALSAIRTAAPFARLPEGYPGTYIDMQISFYYYNPPPAPEQKPKVVPIVTALTT